MMKDHEGENEEDRNRLTNWILKVHAYILRRERERERESCLV